MKKAILYSLACFIISKTSLAQTAAITDKGDEVILYDNGTWKYTKEFRDTSDIIKINPTKFSRPDDASFLLKSKIVHMGFWLNPKLWSFGKSTSNESAEYEITQKKGDMDVVVIAEKIVVPFETLRKIVIRNGTNASPDYHVVKEEYRTVNGLKVLYMECEGTITDIKFSFYGYYYAGPSSILQYIAVAVKDAHSNNEALAQNLLNGLVIVDAAGADLPDTLEKVKIDVRETNGQSLTSTGNDCKKYFPGKWHYTSMMQKVTVERTLQKTVEQIGNYTYEYETKWLSNCEYQLLFKKTDDPNYKVPKKDVPMIIDVLDIDKDSMTYQASYYGHTIKNEMIRDTCSDCK